MANPFQKPEKKKKFAKVAVYGPPGSGKTHFALTFPKPAVIDTESGTDFFTNRFDFQVLKTKKFTEVMSAVEAVEAGEVPCQTLVIDSFTVINDVLKEAYAKIAQDRAASKGRNPDDANLTPRDWGQLKMKIRTLLTRLYNLPVHTVITGWIKDEFEGSDDNLRKVGEAPDVDKKVLYQPDLVIRMHVDKAGLRWGIVEKDRSGTFQVGERIQNPTFAAVEKMLRGFESGAVEPQQTEEQAVTEDADMLGSPEMSTEEQWKRIYMVGSEKGLSELETKCIMYAKYKKPSAKLLTFDQANEFIAGLSSVPEAKLKEAAERFLARYGSVLSAAESNSQEAQDQEAIA